MKALISTLLTVAVLATAVLTGCHTIDDNRIPVAPVNIVFYSVADWDIYGVAGATSYRRFIRAERVPSNFPYTATTFTGYGGILLVSDVMGNPQAFDLSCPVEVKQTVRVAIDPETMLAKCPRCGSTYDVFSLLGSPVSGMAADRGYGLRHYHVSPSGSAYMVVSF